MIIEIDGLAIDVLRKPIKNINLRIYPPHGLVRVSIPLKCNDQLLKKYLREKSTWIKAQQKRMQERIIPEKPVFKTGTPVLFQGNNYTLILEEHSGPSHCALKEKTLLCHLPYSYSQERIESLLNAWYHKEMAALIPDLLTKWQQVIPVKTKEWGIKHMKTRWGSCNTRAHRIWLNLNLIKKPPICLEYVLVHELIHLLEPSHNSRFYAFMDEYMPLWREYKFLLEGKSHAGC